MKIFFEAGRANFRPLAVECLEDRRTPATGWDIRFDDFSGEHASFYQPIRETLLAAAQEWGRYLPKGKGSIQLAVRFDEFEHLAEASSATSVFFKKSGRYEVWESGVAHEIRTGVDPNKRKTDGVIWINSADLVDSFWFDPTPANRGDEAVPADKYDAYSILQHELGHVLGITGWRDWTTGVLPGNDMSRFDQFVSVADDGTAYFHGFAAKGAYGRRAVPLTHTNLYHVGNDTFGSGRGSGRPGADLIDDVMSGVGAIKGTRDQLTPLDLAILKDIGLPVVLPKNTPPVLAQIADQIITAGETLDVPVSLSDLETPAANLQVTVGSNHPGLSLGSGLSLSGSGSQRVLKIQLDTAIREALTVAVTVFDGLQSVSDSFVLTVQRPPPFIARSAAFIDEDDVHTMLVISDAVQGDLKPELFRVTSSNEMLFPSGSLSLDGEGRSWTLTMRPAPNRNRSLDGLATIEVFASDGLNTSHMSVEVTVRPVNDSPVIAPLPDVLIASGGSRELTVNVSDVDSASQTVELLASVSNGALLPPGSVQILQAGSQRRVSITPPAGAEGVSTVVITAIDGNTSSAEAFEVRVTDNPLPWHNARLPEDVNNDGLISMLDALLVINALTEHGLGPLNSSSSRDSITSLCDVDPDNELKLGDALRVINRVNERLRQGATTTTP